jgi:hypothetical protein
VSSTDDPQRHLFVRRFPLAGHADPDMTGLGELHGVADQVEQDLPQAPAIPISLSIRGTSICSLKSRIAILHAGPQQAEDLEDHLEQVELLLVQDQLPASIFE